MDDAKTTLSGSAILVNYN